LRNFADNTRGGKNKKREVMTKSIVPPREREETLYALAGLEGGEEKEGKKRGRDL